MKTAFTELRENTIKLTTRAGYGKIEWNNPRGIFQGGDSGGVQHIGGR